LSTLNREKQQQQEQQQQQQEDKLLALIENRIHLVLVAI
jgi:hypothetical protein